MKRRTFLTQVTVATTAATSQPILKLLAAASQPEPGGNNDPALRNDWLTRWQQHIVGESRHRYCDNEIGEELGWLVSPFLNGFYYGYLATQDPAWLERLIDWTDSCLKRAITEPDGFPGWPKGDGGGGESKEYAADSLLGEAMLLRPVLLATAAIRKTPALRRLLRY